VPEARNKIDAPMFEPEVFWKQMHCVEEGTLLGFLYCREYIVGTFCTKRTVLKKVHFWRCWDFLAPPAVIRCSRSDLASGELCPFGPP